MGALITRKGEKMSGSKIALLIIGGIVVAGALLLPTILTKFWKR
jgi:hypothetical protein